MTTRIQAPPMATPDPGRVATCDHGFTLRPVAILAEDGSHDGLWQNYAPDCKVLCKGESVGSPYRPGAPGHALPQGD